MANWLTLSDVNVTSGEKAVPVTGHVDLSATLGGWALFINGALVEISSGTAADAAGNSTLTLTEAWTGETLTGQSAKIIPTSSPFLTGIAAMQSTNAYAIEVHSTLAEIATEDKDVTITDSSGNDHTFASMPKNARLIAEMISRSSGDVSDLIDEKAAEMDGAIESLKETLSNSESIIDQNLAESAQNVADAISAYEQQLSTSIDSIDTTLAESKAVAASAVTEYEQQLSASINAIDTTLVSSQSAINASLSAYEQATADLISSSESTAAESIQAQQDIAASIA